MSPEKMNQLESKLQSLKARKSSDQEVLDKMDENNVSQQISVLNIYMAERKLAEDLLEEFFGGQE